MVTVPIDEVPCSCPDCPCTNTADLTYDDGTSLCGCCAADCPDAHGDDGLTWRTGDHVQARAVVDGHELTIPDVGSLTAPTLDDGTARVRERPTILGCDDAATANISTWKPAEPAGLDLAAPDVSPRLRSHE